MIPTQNLNMFIPARALQNVGNPENATLLERIKLAVIRYTRFKDFNSFYLGPHPLPGIYIVGKPFLKLDPLGYAVMVEIKGG